MLDRFDGDPAIRITPDGGTLDYASGQPNMDAGLENAVIISLFTDLGWHGNDLDRNEPDRQIGSRFCSNTKGEPLTSNTLQTIEEDGEQAIQWMINVGAISDVDVTATAPLRDRVDILIDVTKNDETHILFKYELNWIAGSLRTPTN